MQYTNKYDLSLSIAVWLASDLYDHSDNPKEISTTALLDSPRQIILRMRSTSEGIGDVSSKIASSMGTAIHDSLENAWKKNYVKAMQSLNYTDKMISKIKINPNPQDIKDGDLPVYMEQRVKKEINDYIISGKYDFIGNGQLEDYKTTGVYTYVKGSNTEKFRKQGSIYRWLNPNIITDNIMIIQYIFFNWEAFKVSQTGYPKFRILADPIELLSIKDTEKYIVDKLAILDSLKNTPEPELPLCTKEELWQDDAVYAYYKNPTKTLRATKTFSNYYEAQQRYLDDGSVGIIKERPCIVKACQFCEVSSVCTQKDQYIAAGLLILD